MDLFITGLLIRCFEMKIQTECVPCLLKRVIFESKLRNKDKNLTDEIIKESCSMVAELYDPNICSAEIATKVHKRVYELLDDKDPYQQLKQISNEVAQSLVPTIENLLDNSDDRLKTAMIAAIVGNILDFGIEGGSKDPKSLQANFQNYFTEQLGHDDYDRVITILKDSNHVVLFTDNCGEIIFDSILCRELKNVFPHIVLTVVVRGEPIISDATIEDAEMIGMQNIADQVLTTGGYAIGVDFKKLPDEVTENLKIADLIICKGMANYESFSEISYHPIVYLLRSKCTAIARSMDVELDKNIIKLYD
jgi:uncharacterized protein with ATP-grasp and redox domains